jgi:phosphoserine phosphatase RsbU/P
MRESGSILGEMSLFTSRHTHTASVQALTPVVLLELSQEKFETLLNQQPILACKIIQILSNRLEESENLTIQDLHQKNIALTQAYEDLKAAQEQIIEKEVLEKELQIARNIQQSILPQVIPQSETFLCGALMVAARAVGGDFFDFIPLSNGWLGIAVGDVSDKGVPAALSMAMTYSLLHATANHELSPGETLRTVNRHLVEINVSDMFVTLIYGMLDTQSGIFRYARAGHPPPYLTDEFGHPLIVPTKLGQALGLFDHLILDEQEIEIPPNGWLVLYSDGLSEAMDAQGEFFSLEAISDLFREDMQLNPQSFCQTLWQAVQVFSAGIPQSDDFTIAALKRVIKEKR